MIDPNHELTVKRQAEILGISRASVYYVPRGVSEADLALMRHIDELHRRCCTNGRRGEFLPRATGGLEGGLRFGHAESSHGIHGRHARIDLGHLTAETACLEPGTE